MKIEKLSDVIQEAKVLVKNCTKVADRGVLGEYVGRYRVEVEINRRVWNFS